MDRHWDENTKVLVQQVHQNKNDNIANFCVITGKLNLIQPSCVKLVTLTGYDEKGLMMKINVCSLVKAISLEPYFNPCQSDEL